MRILTVGGGSGGHVTPVRAVINELSRHDSTVEVRFICDRKFYPQAKQIMSHADIAVKVQTILAGKLRRYHGVSAARQITDVPTLLHNIGDIVLVALGTVQSLFTLLRWRPDVVFTKGGFVCLPVGFAAKVLRIPLVIHDSDAHPGLTNRILAKWATSIATGAPLENYAYPKSKSRYVGIPVEESFAPLDADEQKEAKSRLGLVDISRPLVVVTGGGLGAKRINDAMTNIAPSLLEEHASIYHITGQGQYEAVSRVVPDSVDYIVKPFVYDGMRDVLGAADVIVTRAGATTLLELAALAKPIIIIPNPMLTGGHQLKNAAVYEQANAAVIVDETSIESQPSLLFDAIMELIDHPDKAKEYGKKLQQFAKPDAALDVAEMIVSAAKVA